MKIYVISLKRSPERREYIKKQLDDLSIEFEFFDAVDGRVEPPHPLFKSYNYTKRLWLTSGRMPLRENWVVTVATIYFGTSASS